MGFDLGAKASGQRHLGQGNRHAAVGNVVHRGDQAGCDQLADELAGIPLEREVDRRRFTVFATVDLAQP